MNFEAFNVLRANWRRITLLVVPIILIAANSPQRGLSEGGQGWVSHLSDKVDFWGSILPIITRDDSMRISFILSLISLSVYWFGLATLISRYQFSSREFLGILLLGSFGAVFSQQNLRDAFLLSFSMLSLGLVEKYSDSRVFLYRYLFLLPLILAVTFKYPSAIAITILIVLRFHLKTSTLNLRNTISISLASGLIILLGVILDKSLARSFSLEKGFVEQSVMYYDLASFYCWSEDRSTRSSALEALMPLLANGSPQDICLSHRPNAWIYLVSGGNFRDEGVKAPLTQLTGDKDLSKASHLRGGWLRTIAHDPVDYIQFKLIAATQILTVGNPFLFASQTFVNPQIPSNLGDYLWLPISLIIMLVGKLYFFSEIAIFTVFFFILKGNRFPDRNRDFIFKLLWINLINVIVMSASFVSDEARYVFPLLVLSYLLVLVNHTSSRSRRDS
jgi:hypothetical protein